MDRLNFEQTEILSKQIILSFVDFSRLAASPFIDSSINYRLPLKQYDDFRIEDKEKFRKELYRLKQNKFIKKYYQNKEPFLILTKKGKELVKKYLVDQLGVKQPEKWDKKWRLVVFDIPDRKRKIRDFIRRKLESIGFIKLQESVYVYPFDCLNEIDYLKNNYFVAPHIQYIVAERIESEINLIKKFLDLHILEEKMLK